MNNNYITNTRPPDVGALVKDRVGDSSHIKSITVPMPPAKVHAPAPFTEDETIMRKIGNTTYILTAKFKQGASEGMVDKLLRLIENNDETSKDLEI
ncbi:transposon-encoded TnpW family protein [Candidatus Saccharibacteria bacterium]|nr:transposon-encoded TnpW family protein [Candidatus Saccharibacteria bacterium]